MPENPFLTPAAPADLTAEPDNADVARVAKTQRAAVRWVLILFVGMFIPFAGYVLLVTLAFALYRLAQALRWRGAIAWGILSLVPVLNIFFLLTLNAQATKLLRARGVRVGLLGANASDAAKLSV